MFHTPSVKVLKAHFLSPINLYTKEMILEEEEVVPFSSVIIFCSFIFSSPSQSLEVSYA
jgi:hypothetical protein